MARVLFSSLPFKNFLTLIEELSLLVSTFTFTFKLGNRPVALSRASDISRKKRKISRDFQGQIRGKIGQFRGKKVKIRGKIGRFRGIFAGQSQNSQKNRPISRVSVQKSQILKDFQGQVLSKIGRFHGKFRGETSPRNNQ